MASKLDEEYDKDVLKANLWKASVNDKRLWEYLESRKDLLHIISS
jgi:hypothetical protein